MLPSRIIIPSLTIALLMLGGIGLNRLHAQVAAATILGTVTDASGAAIPDAAVQVKNVGTGLTQTVNTDNSGRFSVPDLGIGDYEVQASKTGFATSVHRGITLTVGAQSVVDFSLPVGQQTQTVTVEGEVSQVETTNSQVSTLISTQQMEELPLNGRSFEQLIYTAPGVSIINTMAPNARQGRANAFSTAGARPQGYTLLMDDEAIDNFFRRGMGTITGSSLGMEGMAEFQILTNTYGAQFGGNGAVMNAVSKSGTNAVHGSAYLFERNSAMDSRGFFDPSLLAFRRTQPGGSVGGPVKKDKAFFFFNYEGIWQLQDISHIAIVPDANHRTPTFSPSVNPTSYAATAAALAVYPLPTFGFNPAAGTGETNVLGNNIAHENFILGRFDYILSSKDSFMLRYFYDKQHVIDPYAGGNGSVSAGYLPYWPERDEGMNHFATLEWKRVISPTVVNTARFSFSRPNTADYQVNSIPSLQLTYPGAGRPDPEISISGITPLGQSFFVPAVDIQNRFTEADDIVLTKGAHTIHVGAYVQRVDSNVFYPFRDGGVWSYTGGLNQFLSGAPATPFTGTPPNSAQCIATVGVACYSNRDYRELDFTPYFQDDWKVSRRLTLNLGIRWEGTTNAYALHNDLYAVVNPLTDTALTHVPNVSKNNPNLKNWDPRFGFAYDIFADHKTSLRGGFAITHDPIFTAEYNADYTAVTPWPGLTGSFVYPTANFSALTVVNAVTNGYDYNINKAPYLIQYNLNIQRDLGQGTVLTVGYVGSHGVDLLTEQELNPPTPIIDADGVYHFGHLNATGTAVVANPRLNPHFTFLQEAVPGTTSRYNSLQVSLNRRLNRNIMFQVSYTWSHCIDDGSSPLASISGGNTSSLYENPYKRDPYDVGLCYFNAKSNLRANALYTFPFHGNQAVEGWQLSGIITQSTGLPFSVYDGADVVGYSSSGNPRPNYLSGCDVNTRTVHEWFNPACFTLQAPGTLGNLGRDTIIGPGLAQLDLALVKDTRIPKISEVFRVQFRAEAYNLFNHPQFGQPGNSIFSSVGGRPNGSAGQITSIAPNSNGRQIQLGVKFLF